MVGVGQIQEFGRIMPAGPMGDQGRQGLGGILDDDERLANGRPDEAVLDTVLDHGDHRVVEAVVVDDDDGFVVVTELAADDDLKELKRLSSSTHGKTVELKK